MITKVCLNICSTYVGAVISSQVTQSCCPVLCCHFPMLCCPCLATLCGRIVAHVLFNRLNYLLSPYHTIMLYRALSPLTCALPPLHRDALWPRSHTRVPRTPRQSKGPGTPDRADSEGSSPTPGSSRAVHSNSELTVQLMRTRQAAASTLEVQRQFIQTGSCQRCTCERGRH